MSDGLTPIQADYFRTLESLNPSDRLKRSIEITKAELRRENASTDKAPQ